MPNKERSSFKSDDVIRNNENSDEINYCIDGRRNNMGRPRKEEHEKYKSTHIRLHPKVVEWAKAEAEKRGIGYQSVINETLLELIIS
jgi:uncharacterized protein (DUF4415 family)